MLFKQRFWDGLADGSVTVAFRRWRRPTVKAGGTLTVPVGVLSIDGVARITTADITDGDALRAGFPRRDELLEELDRRADGDLYRIEFRYLGADPRPALADDDQLSPEDHDQIRRRLDRMDRASASGPWTTEVLRLIEQHPRTAAHELAAMAGRERDEFKRDVRKLKALGLTISCDVGYLLSPRGTAVVSRRP